MDLPSTLTERLRTRKILPFVGAGVSMEVKTCDLSQNLFPSWKQLLERAASSLKDEGKLANSNLVTSLLAVDPPELQQAAEHARKHLGPVWFTFLKKQFDHDRNQAAAQSLRLAEAIWELGSNLLVTTNYDRVLRWTSPNPNDVAVWNIESPAEQAAVLRDNLRKPAIWHLHGHIDDAASMILTPDGYDRLYSDLQVEKRFSAALSTLNSLLSSHSFLFIGFSFSDDTFGLHLKAISDVFLNATGPHYALIHTSQIEKLRAQKLPGIELLPFSDYGAPLIALVKQLASIAAPEGPISHTQHLSIPATSSVVTPSFPHTPCDTPPPTTPWVGRVTELNLIHASPYKVIAITGIGGQGKSTLAAKYLSEAHSDFSLLDWRDCKEESNTFHTHLLRIIERITNGSRSASELANETTESVIRLFFNLILSHRAIFIFDNIDQYVDVYTCKAVDGVHLFIESALKSAGSSRFVFTARPKLQYDHPYFLPLALDGLTHTESKQLFSARGLSINETQINDVHELTQGHPLWLNLIAMQVHTNRVTIRDLVSRVKAGKDAGLPEAMLQEIWRPLKPKHQKLLRYLAEMVRPETESQISIYASKDINYNQCSKALRQLRSLALVVVKSPLHAPDTFELHPLLREFIRRQFSQSDRSPYISCIIVCFDKLIAQFRASLPREASHDVLSCWSAKVELLVNQGKSSEAIAALDEARLAMLRSGYSEEFVRLAIACFSNYSALATNTSDSTTFDDVSKSLIEVLSQLGRFSEAERYINLFRQYSGASTARSIAICEVSAYCYWSQGRFDLAKEWGLRGVEQKRSGHLDTRHDCGHNLALAQRDSGDVDNALRFFLKNASKEEVVDPKTIDKGRSGNFYGNIGRCFYLAGDFDSAESCLLKSAWLLERDDSSLVLLNQGWAACWLGDLYCEKIPARAILCYRRAILKWRQVSPFRAESTIKLIKNLTPDLPIDEAGSDDWKVNKDYLAWLSKVIKFSVS